MPVELIALTLFALSQIGTPGPANMALLATGGGIWVATGIALCGGCCCGKTAHHLAFGLWSDATGAISARGLSGHEIYLSRIYRLFGLARGQYAAQS